MAEGSQQDALLAEYTEVNENFRMLADIRFRLLALIPTLGGVAIFLLSRMEQSEPRLGFGLLFLVSCLGFLATLGVTLYDQRNNEFYEDLIRRAKYLENELKLPRDQNRAQKVNSKDIQAYEGQFAERPQRGERKRFLFKNIELGHDPGLALVYGAVLGAWFYPLSSTLFGWTLGPVGSQPEILQRVPLILAVIMVVVFVRELLRLDGRSIRMLLLAGRSESTPSMQPGEQQPGEQRQEEGPGP